MFKLLFYIYEEFKSAECTTWKDEIILIAMVQCGAGEASM